MEKKERMIYTFIVILVLVFLAFYFSNLPLTGHAILGQYTSETDCVAAGYAWENFTNESCTDIPDCVVCEAGCVTGYTQILCEEHCKETCGENETGCIVCTPGCVENYTEILCASGCQENCQNCSLVVTGGQCTGDVCDSTHLNLCDETNCAGAGGYWYSGTCNSEEEEEEETTNETTTEPESDVQVPVVTTQAVQEITALSASEISVPSLNPGDSQEIKWTVQNTGTVQLNACKLRADGELSSWLSLPDDVTGLVAGEQKEFLIYLIIPQETAEGTYSFNIYAECAETSVSKGFNANVIKEKLGFDILSAEKTRRADVRVYYSLEELSGEAQNVEIYFSLTNPAGQELSNASENKSIKADASKEFKVYLPINESLNQSLEGNLTLSARFNSEVYSSSVQEPIMLTAPVGGFAIFEEGIGTGSIVLLAAVVLALIIILVVVRIRKKSKNLK